jgi:DnaJ-class molecular chaperone
MIKKAYKSMALRWHPDKRAGDPEATRIFQQVVEAYNTLKDPQERLAYDLMEWNREIGSTDTESETKMEQASMMMSPEQVG